MADLTVDQVVAAARSYLGLEPTDPAYLDRVYLGHLPGGGTPLQRAQAQQMARTQSGCGLVYEAQLRDLGVTWPHLWRWYGDRMGTAISANVSAAKKDRIWYTPTDPGPGIQAGDAVVIGGPPPAWSRGGIAYEHLLVVTAVGADGVITSVDGGQPGVAERTRVLVRTPQGELWLANLPSGGGPAPLGPDGRPLVGRRVQGWIKSRLAPNQPGYRGGGEATVPPPNQGGANTPYQGGGGTSGGGGATDAGGECPPCSEGISIRKGIGLLLLAYLLGDLTGQWVEGRRR